MLATNNLDKAALEKAHHRIRPYINHTAIVKSTSINKWVGAEVYFKCENFQKMGAFKKRGATNYALQCTEEERQKGFCTHSSGNHAQAVASISSELGVASYIVMPDNSNKSKVEAVKTYGGKITFCEPTHEDREKRKDQVQEKTGAVFIPPFDHPWIIEGQATAAMEFFAECKDMDALMVPVGGGGLLAGSCLAAKYFSFGTKVYGCEPDGANDAWQSLKTGRHIKEIVPNTVADGLRTPLGATNYKVIKQDCAGIFTVSDAEIIEAMRIVWERMKIIIEPSSAVAIAALKRNKEMFSGKKVGVIISGGNVDLGSLPF